VNVWRWLELVEEQPLQANASDTRYLLNNFLLSRGISMINCLVKLWTDEIGQDIAEYAVLLAVILVLVVGTIRLVGTNANNVFSSVASSVQ
jgi:Flp pilus assembly pilin Flp